MKDISTYKSGISSVKFSRKLEISQHEIVSSKNGRTYNNASVRITDLANGIESKKTSDMMFGTNADNVSIGYGEYVSEEEVEEALRKELEEAGQQIGGEAHYVNKKGEVQNIEDIIKTVSLASGRIVIGDRNEKITNQNSANWGIEERGTGTYKKKGVAFLGNSGMQLPKGGYVSRDELIKALEEYEIKIPEKAMVQTQEMRAPRGITKEEIVIPEFLRKYSKAGTNGSNARKVDKLTYPGDKNKAVAQGFNSIPGRRIIKDSDLTIPEISQFADQRRREDEQIREEFKKSAEQLKLDLNNFFGEENKEVNNPFYISLPTNEQVEFDMISEREMEKIKSEIASGIDKVLEEESLGDQGEVSSDIQKMIDKANEENFAEENKPRSFRITKVVKSRVAAFAAIAAIGMCATIGSYVNSAYNQMLDKKDKLYYEAQAAVTISDIEAETETESEVETEIESESTTNEIEYDNVLTASYNITEKTVIADLEDLVQAEIDNQFASLEMGDSINVENGVNVYTSSNAKNYKTIGESGFFSAGTYNITGVAITYEGKLLGYIENFDNSVELQGTNLNEFKQNISEKSGVPENDVTVMVCVNKAGWVFIDDLVNENTISGENLIEQTIATAELTGTIYNFDGKTITFDNGETIQVVDDEGNQLNEIEIDGRTYIINSLDITETQVPIEDQEIEEPETEQFVETESEPETETETELETEPAIIDNTTKKSLKFNFLDIKNFLALPGLLGIAVAKIAEKRKNKYNDLHATFKKTESGFEAQSLKDHVNNYDEMKMFYSMGKRISFKEYMENCLKSLFVKESRWEVRELSDENRKEIEEIILKESANIESLMSDGRTFYDTEVGDYLDIVDGEVVVRNNNSGREEVLPIEVVKKISQIGKDNNLFAVGGGLPNFVPKANYDDDWMGSLRKACNKVSKLPSSFINGVRDKLRHDSKDLKVVSNQEYDDDTYEKF